MNLSFTNILIAVAILSQVGACQKLDSHALAGEKKQIARISPPCANCLRLIRDPQGRTNRLGNPIYLLEAYHNGQKVYSLAAVAGRAYTQQRNRHQSGTEAPLPDGQYQLSSTIVPGTIVEAGETFIPVYPRFRTGRTALGIHYDPSFNLNNGEDGTSGCIALTNRSDRDKINRFVSQYKPQELIVDIE